MKWYTIGSLTLPATQVALVLAFLLIGIFLWWRKEKELSEVYGNAVFLFIAVWKFSTLLFQFPLVLSAPMSLLYFNGGIKGFLLAFAVVFLYLIIKLPSHRWGKASELWMILIAVYELLRSLLNGQIGLEAWIPIAGVVLLWKLVKNVKDRLILFTLWQVLLYSWYDMLFSTELLAYILGGVILLFFIRRYKHG